jgi:hypothetical protein
MAREEQDPKHEEDNSTPERLAEYIDRVVALANEMNGGRS